MTTKEEVYQALSLILNKRFKVSNDLISYGANLENDLGLDSIEYMDAISLVEYQFKIKLISRGASVIDFPKTIGELVDLVFKKITD